MKCGKIMPYSYFSFIRSGGLIFWTGFPYSIMLSEREKIDLIAQITLDINKVKDIDILLERILTNVRKFSNADAGSIYLKEGNELKFSYTQNETLQQRLDRGKKLIFNTYSIPIDDNSIAGYAAKERKVLNIPDVYNMNNGQPYTWDSHFDILSDYRTRSMLTVPMTDQREDLLGVMQVINARDNRGEVIPFAQSDEPLIQHLAMTAALSVDRAQMTRDIILRMISMAELRDPKETSSHVNRVAAYSVELFEEWAKRKGWASEQIERQKDSLRMAAMLHDVGKIAITDLILRKPSPLTKDEFEIMKSHTYVGACLFRNVRSGFEELAAEVALNHHEKWDGTGYPGHIDPITGKALPGFEGNNGHPRPKKGNEIPIFGRIVAVADVYDALCSPRSYKEPWNESRILEEMRSLSGTHFDPEVIDVFFSCLDAMQFVAKRYPDEDV
jgi:response regulator RpfG family c-di-GMP phosphodiesterase